MSGFWNSRPVFVTGATGLVGSWIVKALLRERAEVVCLVRDTVPQSELNSSGDAARVRIVNGDIRDQALLERTLGEYEIDTVFHLAAQTIVGVANRNPISTFASNIEGTWALLEAARRSPSVRQIVVASSDKAYGDQQNLPYEESTPLEGRHPYDVSKSCADLIAQSYAHSYALPVVVTRCGNFYGGGDLNWNRIIPGTIRSLLRNEAPVIRSDGEFIRDYFYVEDGAAAYLLLAERLAGDRSLIGHAFNFSNESQVTVVDLVRRITRQMGSQLQPRILNQASNEIRNQHLSARKAKDMLDWSPLFTLDQGLDATIAWYRNWSERARESARAADVNTLATVLR